MGLYARLVLPRLLAAAMRQPNLVPFRASIGRAASGRVLELGIGPALNLPFYGPDVTAVIGIDPSPQLLAMAEQKRGGQPFDVQLIEGSAEALPLSSGSIDTVVTTWTLCTVPSAPQVLAEARRVLKPGGKLLFAEHGRAPGKVVARWQDRLDPVWTRIAGGCHTNRPIADHIVDAGFRMDQLTTAYIAEPRVLTFMYSGFAMST
ncbi:MAG: class I SAM-dependent methyltransferase [Janthinobacterium lividum]